MYTSMCRFLLLYRIFREFKKIDQKEEFSQSPDWGERKSIVFRQIFTNSRKMRFKSPRGAKRHEVEKAERSHGRSTNIEHPPRRFTA
jgi:hypothetical protein